MSTAEWYVVVTRPQSERRTARALRRAGYRVYVPTRRCDVRNRRTGKWSPRRFVLFGSYVLVRLMRPDWLTLLTTDGVLAVLGQDEPLVLSRVQVRQIMIAQRKGTFDVRMDTRAARRRSLLRRFPEGSQARITEGPFGGLTMTIRDVSGPRHVVGEITLLRQSIAITVDVHHLARLDEKRNAA